MAVREFDGVNDRIVTDNGIIGQLANGAFTLLCVAKPASTTGTESMVSVVNGSNWVAALQRDSTALGFSDDDDFRTGLGGTVNTAWQILAVTLSAPGGTPRFHRKQLGSGAWGHGNGGGTVAGNTISAATCEFGSTNNGSFSSFWDGRMAVAAIFGEALSDGALESLQATPATQTIYDLGPLALWDFNQASTATDVVDLMGNGADQTAITGTAVITGDDPTWTFGVSAGLTPPFASVTIR